MTDAWTMHDLQEALDKFEGEVRSAGLSDNTVTTYVDRADRFLRYCERELAELFDTSDCRWAALTSVA